MENVTDTTLWPRRSSILNCYVQDRGKEKELSFATHSTLKSDISLQPDGVNLLYFKLFHPTECIGWKSKGLLYQDC